MKRQSKTKQRSPSKKRKSSKKRVRRPKPKKSTTKNPAPLGPASQGWTASSRKAFMDRALAIILANPKHRLRFLVDPKTRKWKSRDPFSEEPTVQAGHLVSRHSGAPERYGIQDSAFNQLENWRGETQGAIFIRPAVDIDGVPVELQTAMMFRATGQL